MKQITDPDQSLTPSRDAGENTATELSYASQHDNRLVRLLIRGVEFLSGSRRLQRVYDQLLAEQLSTSEIWGRGLEKLNISVDYDPQILEMVPAKGPVVFVANHPFGVVDGVILCHLISRVRDDFFLLVNESVLPQPSVAKHLLPIDFRPVKDALASNLQTKRLTTARLRDGQALAIFPSGCVATSKTLFGPAEELPWHTFVSRRIHEAQCTVVPLYFHGQNSRLFQLASRVNVHLRLGLLMHETSNKIGKKIRVKIGEPIQYEDVQGYRNAQEMIEYLRTETMNLAEAAGDRRLRRRIVLPVNRLKKWMQRKDSSADLSVSP